MAAYTRCLRCAGAPRRPASGSGLSLLIPSWHAVLSDPGVLDPTYPEIRCRHWPSPNDHRLGTPDTPAIRSARAVDFVASLVRFRYSLPGCSPPCTDQTGTPSLGDFYFQAFNGSVSLPVAGYNYNSDWTPACNSHPLERQLASLHGHSRPMPRVAPTGSCPFRSESDHVAAQWRNDALCQQRT